MTDKQTYRTRATEVTVLIGCEDFNLLDNKVASPGLEHDQGSTLTARKYRPKDHTRARILLLPFGERLVTDIICSIRCDIRGSVANTTGISRPNMGHAIFSTSLSVMKIVR
eukprot:557046-Amphidinium_carterae.1